MTTPLKIAVLVSGNGSNLQVLIDAMQAGELPIDILGVISNNDEAYALTRANDANIPTAILSHVTSGKRMGIKTFEKHALAQLQDWQPDLIVLAGFMRVLSSEFIANAPAPMINLHPSLLPDYKGLDTHARVLQAGESQHGCSVHIVTADLDAGQVLTQAVLNIDANDNAVSLQSRVHQLEHRILPWTILLIAKAVIPLRQINSSQPIPQNIYLPNFPLRLIME